MDASEDVFTSMDEYNELKSLNDIMVEKHYLDDKMLSLNETVQAYLANKKKIDF